MPESGPDVEAGYVNVFQVTSTREEIVLLLGERQPMGKDPEEVRARLKERIILSPFTAKRLAMMLGRGLRDYESRYGPLDVKRLPSTEPDQVNLPRQKLPSFKTEIAGENV